MPSFTVTRRIDAPVERVYAVFTDIESAADNIAGITRLEVLTDGPIGVGTRFRETRLMFKKEATEEFEISEFQPNASYTVTATTCGALWTTTFRFEPDGDGTRVDVEMVITPLTFFAKLMSPLSKLMSGPMLKCLSADLDDLQRLAEGNRQTAQPA